MSGGPGMASAPRREGRHPLRTPPVARGTPLLSVPGGRRAEVGGRVNPNGLLVAQEAVYLHVVAGAGFEPATFGL